MSCPTHGTACAYIGTEPNLCPVCHCNWLKIEKPVAYVASHGISKDTGEPWQILNYTGGYGETREQHLAGHQKLASRRTAAAAKRGAS